MRSKIFLIGFLLLSTLWSQQPPSWINLGELPDASRIYDILEIPYYNIILACGYGSNNRNIWRTTDGGITWNAVLSAGSNFFQFKQDTTTGRIWVVRENTSNPLYYSDNIGNNWYGISGPPNNPAITGYTIELIGSYLYFGGSVSNPNSISLYRLNTTNLQWEFVMQYPQCNAITRMRYWNGRLLVFARDKTQNLIRVFSHTLEELNKKAKKLEKAKVSEAE